MTAAYKSASPYRNGSRGRCVAAPGFGTAEAAAAAEEAEAGAKAAARATLAGDGAGTAFVAGLSTAGEARGRLEDCASCVRRLMARACVGGNRLRDLRVEGPVGELASRAHFAWELGPSHLSYCTGQAHQGHPCPVFRKLANRTSRYAAC
jgi:hypothetical protein